MKLHDNFNKQIGGIYKITNFKNKKTYIGSAIYIKKRWNQHLNDLKQQKHSNPYLQKAFNKYGKKNFKFEILECILFRDEKPLIEREQFYLDRIF